MSEMLDEEVKKLVLFASQRLNMPPREIIIKALREFVRNHSYLRG